VARVNAVAERVAQVRRRITDAGGDPARVTIVAVTKGFGAEAVDAAAGAGLVDVGENYAQELLAKAGQVESNVRWHFLGAVQRNKVPRLAPHVAVWQGVDRLEAGEEIARRSPGATVLVQVNIDGAPQRNGCPAGDVHSLVRDLQRLDLDVAGLMAVATAGDEELATRQFAAMAAMREELGLRELSIGMTDDLEVAIRAGSTMVRIGRALFGERPNRPL
jgi:PLP dependent protein